jgi:hypothetical protein
VKIKTRIERLERREGFDASGPIPITVFDRVLDGTISDAEWERWRPSFERILAGEECRPGPQRARGYSFR